MYHLFRCVSSEDLQSEYELSAQPTDHLSHLRKGKQKLSPSRKA